MYSSHSHSFFGIHFNKHKYIISFVISCYVWPCYFLIAHCQLITLLTFSVCLFCIYFTYSESIPCMFHYGFLLHLTLGCRHSKQIFPELTIRLTDLCLCRTSSVQTRPTRGTSLQPGQIQSSVVKQSCTPCR